MSSGGPVAKPPRGGAGGLPACGFLVHATKNGGLPLTTEKRAKGKVVTLISSVQGNAVALCSTLTTVLGVGGTVQEVQIGSGANRRATVEVQGDQVDRVGKVLTQLACVRGLAVTKETAAYIVERQGNAHDSVLKEGSASSTRRKPRHADRLGAEIEPPPEDAPCRAWHGYWPYCKGMCTKMQTNLMEALSLDVWDETKEPPGAQRQTWTTVQKAAPASALERALSCLGMHSEAGAAVAAFVRAREESEATAMKRRLAPQTSYCAPGHTNKAAGEFICDECGATFSMKGTLKKHKLQHQRDREEAGDFSHLAAEATSWRKETLALESNEWGWENHWRADGIDDVNFGAPESDEDVMESHAPASNSLSAFISVAIDKKSKKAKSAAKPKAAAKVQLAACPVCGQHFPMDTMDWHVDECLSKNAAEYEEDSVVLIGRSAACASSARPPAGVRDAKTGQPGNNQASEDGSLPLDLLASLLDMDLTEDCTARFWSSYARCVESGRMAPEDAFLKSLEFALADSDDDEEGTSTWRPAASSATCAVSTCADAAAYPAVKDRGDAPANMPETEEDGFVQQRRRGRWGNNAQSKATPKPAPVHTSADRSALRRSSAKVADNSTSRTSQDARASVPARQPASQAAHSTPQQDSEKKAAAIPPSLWLLSTLQPLIGDDAADSVAAGVEVVLGNPDDPDAAENAGELLLAELAECNCCDAVLEEFRRRLAAAGGRWS
eukprot:TRINITY_DN32815_c0_g1_i1.p1 TRINITY_DN32815_c0_g1~~TRINITY_DN32815_c0_g1_i1.p1  ORF type:complete len:726 (-),score=135.55 TRINITY_DN32815_c0_g1_i1:234-2411(-)